MRIFINNVDSYVGKALCADLRQVLDKENKLFGTVSCDASEVDGDLLRAMGVKRLVSRTNRRQYLRDVLSCSLIVFDLHSSSVEDAELVVKQLKISELAHEIVFVLVSSVSVWARTRNGRVPLKDPDEEEAEVDEEEEEEGVVREVPDKPKELKDSDLDRRVPLPAVAAWKYLEMLTLSLSSRQKVRPHVVAAGVLYGNGETTFNELFKAAWLTQAKHRIIAPGNNYIPCVHVRDVARLVRVVASDASVGRYLVAVDRARLTQAEIIQGVVNQMATKYEVPTVEADSVQDEFKDVMMLDLIMQPSAPMRSKEFPWWCKQGLVANIERVAAEFCKWRNLRPIKMVIVGPPGSGAERFCSRVSERYLHEDPPHLTLDHIIQDAMEVKDSKGRPTRSAIRLRRKVAKLAATAGAQLKLKLRSQLVKARLLSNVCRYRGYILEDYPRSAEEADALFMQQVYAEGEEPPAEEAEEEEVPEGEELEEEEEEEEEEEGAKPDGGEEDEDEEAEDAPKFELDASIAPEFVVVLHSSEEMCKARIFSGLARGASSEEEFAQRMQAYRRANLIEDGRPCTSDFFEEKGGVKVLHIDVDSKSDEEVFETMRVYLESKGQFFNYLRSEEDLARDRAAVIAAREEEEDARREQELAASKAAELATRREREEAEAGRLKLIADSEASLLETEAQPLRQYLMINVVPTLTEGLLKLCKELPEDPLEYLSEYLFAHAQDIGPHMLQGPR